MFVKSKRGINREITSVIAINCTQGHKFFPKPLEAPETANSNPVISHAHNHNNHTLLPTLIINASVKKCYFTTSYQA